MQLPSHLQKAIESEVSKYGLGNITRAAADLSEKYRLLQPSTERFITTELDRLAYIAVRMPATFAAARAVFAEMRRLATELPVNSLLDLGAGPGTAAWAAVNVFEDVHRITLIEQDRGLISLGKTFAGESEDEALRSADWLSLNLKTVDEFPAHDLVVCSYSLGEIETEAARKVLRAAWYAAIRAIAIIEPGTMKGFELVRNARDELIKSGGNVLAPCPHHQTCPMSGDDWCHFARRFQRTPLHRRIKSAALGYEDEKFSYIVVAKHPVRQVQARVIRHPLRRPGYTQIQICDKDQLRSITVTRSDRELWKRARKIDWGDDWEVKEERKRNKRK
ncbi:MAG: small ribosomal subunit Rsm22 family protein [Acidobacteria bacterium]|nr:small ribosomal subunit Rsm22 family protein [Acidobacteriota bacterium]